MALVPLEEIREWWSSTNSVITLHTSLASFYLFIYFNSLVLSAPYKTPAHTARVNFIGV